ncbi:DUF302 domain-containing protein [Sulfitobacter sp. PS-8MA]|uniref:DUF302 domain-containing protein n=1 Tax=Sulfitobacter sp. PS-8MA TaxID=3237707 RepID=UPI0034C5F1C2
MVRFIFAAALMASAAHAEDMVTYTTDQSFDDVTFGVENAILNLGLVPENVSHVGDMLERTAADVGSEVKVFEAADVFSFCSASLSRKVMEADPMNLGFCPYDIFVMQLPDSAEVTVGYRAFPEGPMQEVQSLLDEIVKEAIGQ